MCEIAFELVAPMRVGRVIARPFVGTAGSFQRTANRHDYAVRPPRDTLLDLLTRQGIPVVSIGKVRDLFAGRGIARAIPTKSDSEGVDRLLDIIQSDVTGLVFINLVDFDTLYGHRNDVGGYARNLEQFDERLGQVLPLLRETDLLIITADHGNDPTTPSTDHSREHVPILITGWGVRAGVNLGTRNTFADLGQTLAANFGVGPLVCGTSFLEEIVVEYP
jgi:phosphopentomutase